jgi:hypothetical protein
MKDEGGDVGGRLYFSGEGDDHQQPGEQAGIQRQADER